jgi:hypothetical protein
MLTPRYFFSNEEWINVEPYAQWSNSEELDLRVSGILKCPKPPPKVDWPGALNQMGLSWSDVSPMRSIGRELYVAFICIGADEAATADNGFWLRKCRELFLRPAAEPLLLAHWDKLKSFGMTEEQLASFCSLICGGTRQHARTKDHYGVWDGGNVKFESAARAKQWWADIQSVAAQRSLDLLLPAYCFARTIIAHPYPDGNGRLARALVHAALARTFDYRAPFLPLAPAFYMNGARVAVALCQLCEDGDWNAFNAVFWCVIEDSQALARRLQVSR